MTKLITGIALLAGAVLLVLSDSKVADAQREDLELHVALPLASGGSQTLQFDAIRGEALTVTNLETGSMDGQLHDKAYRIEGQWVSNRELRLAIHVATTTAYEERPDSVQWTPEVELVEHELTVRTVMASQADAPTDAAPGGIPRAALLRYPASNRS